MSTFSIAVDDLKNGVNNANNNKGSGLFHNSFLNKINFAQSKVLETGYNGSNVGGNVEKFISPQKKLGINPF